MCMCIHVYLATRQSVFLGWGFSERIGPFICDRCSEGASLSLCLLLLLVLENSLNTTSAALWINERTDVLVLGSRSYIHSLTKCHLCRDFRAKSIPWLVVAFLLCHLLNLGSGIFCPSVNIIYLLSSQRKKISRQLFPRLTFLPMRRKESHC